MINRKNHLEIQRLDKLHGVFGTVNKADTADKVRDKVGKIQAAALNTSFVQKP